MAPAPYARLFENEGFRAVWDQYDDVRYNLKVTEANEFLFGKWCSIPDTSPITHLWICLLTNDPWDQMTVLANAALEFPRKMPNLQVVRLHSHDKLGLRKLYRFIDALALTTCEELYLVGFHAKGLGQSYGEPYRFQNPSRLEKLFVSSVHLSGQEFAPLVAHFSSLKCFSMRSFDGACLSPTDMGYVLSQIRCPSTLESITLEYVDVLPYEYASLVQRHPKLQSFTLLPADRECYNTLPSLHPSIEPIYLTRLDSTYGVVRTLLERCTVPPPLEILRVTLAPVTSFTLDVQIATISAVCPVIKHLDLIFQAPSNFHTYGSPMQASFQAVSFLSLSSALGNQVLQLDDFLDWFQTFPSIKFLWMNDVRFEHPFEGDEDL